MARTREITRERAGERGTEVLSAPARGFLPHTRKLAGAQREEERRRLARWPVMRRALILLLLVTAAADHYHTLSVPRKATQDDVKAAYRRLARVHHPDKPDGCPERFRRINEANEVLSSPQRRREYDASLRNPFAQAGGSGGFRPGGTQPGYSHPFASDPRFEAFFGRSSREEQKAREELKPVSPAVRIFACELHELDSGCVKTITLQDSMLSRLRDALSEGRSGRAAQVAQGASDSVSRWNSTTRHLSAHYTHSLAHRWRSRRRSRRRSWR